MTKQRRDFYCYGLLRPDGTPFYVGKGHGEPRVVEHVRVAQNGKRGGKYRVIRKILREGGTVGYVEFARGLTEKQAFAKEVEMIAAIGRRPNGPLQNNTDGGEGVSGRKRTLSEIARGIITRRVRHAAAGTSWQSKEGRARISASKLGRPRSEETKAKISATKRARPYKVSEATRAKLSAKGKGRKQSPEHIAARVAARQAKGNYKHTAEAKAKISVARRNQSPESLAQGVATRRRKGSYKQTKAAIAKMVAKLKGREITWGDKISESLKRKGIYLTQPRGPRGYFIKASSPTVN